MGEETVFQNGQITVATIYEDENLPCYYGCSACDKKTLVKGFLKDFLKYAESHKGHRTYMYIVYK